jgi:acetyl esterase/lipase
MLEAMMKLDADARQVLAELAARGRFDITAHSPLQARAYLGAAPRPDGAVVHEVRALTVDGADGAIAARLYRPSAAPDLPVLVWFHGGGMVVGDLTTADWGCRELCMQADAAVVSVAYRLAPEHRFPAAPEDAYSATCWVAAHAAELGIDAACRWAATAPAAIWRRSPANWRATAAACGCARSFSSIPALATICPTRRLKSSPTARS